jgi:hypothetical protein
MREHTGRKLFVRGRWCSVPLTRSRASSRRYSHVQSSSELLRPDCGLVCRFPVVFEHRVTAWSFLAYGSPGCVY